MLFTNHHILDAHVYVSQSLSNSPSGQMETSFGINLAKDGAGSFMVAILGQGPSFYHQLWSFKLRRRSSYVTATMSEQNNVVASKWWLVHSKQPFKLHTLRPTRVYTPRGILCMDYCILYTSTKLYMYTVLMTKKYGNKCWA